MPAHICPSQSNGASLGRTAMCGDCTACFTVRDVVTLYPGHGDAVRGHHVFAATGDESRDSGRVTVTAHTNARTGIVSIMVNGANDDVVHTVTLDVAAVDLDTRTGRIVLPGGTVGLFSRTSKMRVIINGRQRPVATFNITALYSPVTRTVTCPGANLRGSCMYCYARQGFYGLPPVIAATEARTLWLMHHIAAGNIDYLAHNLSEAILRRTIRQRDPVPYYRWFDAGDASNVGVATVILETAKRVDSVARSMNTIVFQWLPTHSADIPEIAAILSQLGQYNVMVRPSERDYGTAESLAPFYLSQGFAAPTGVLMSH